MGFFDWVRSVGKSAVKTVSSVGKAIGSGVRTVGKQALRVGHIASQGLNLAVGTVRDVANKVSDIPVLGEVARGLLDTPIGRRIKELFDTAEDVNRALIEAVEIGDRVDKFGDQLSTLTPSDLKDPATRRRLMDESVSIGRSIGKSTVAKKASQIPQVKKAIDKFNQQQTALGKKIGKDNVQKIKKAIRGQ